MRTLQRTAEAHPRIAHGNHHDSASQTAPKGIGLDRNPAAGAGVLHNILAGLRKRHTESERGLHLQPELTVKNARGDLGDFVHHTVNILRSADMRILEKYV